MKKTWILFAASALTLASCGTKAYEGLRSDPRHGYIAQISRKNEAAAVSLNAIYDGPDLDSYEWSCSFKAASEIKKEYFTLSSSLAGKTIVDFVLVNEHKLVLDLSGEITDKNATLGKITVSPLAFASVKKGYEDFAFTCQVRIGDTTEPVVDADY